MNAGKKAGLVLMLTGAALLTAALLLLTANQREAREAAAASSTALEQLVEVIPDRPAPTPVPVIAPGETAAPILPADSTMTEAVIDGYAYIGRLSIPALELDLPIMAEWDYERLEIAPCRFRGTVRDCDLVLMAHNYSHHFGKLSELEAGDSVIFQDMDGSVTHYEVAVLDVLMPNDVEDMTESPYDLTLFTCTYGGQSRVTVRCIKT